MEEPEIIKMLKYILLIIYTTTLVIGHPLVADPPAVSVIFSHSASPLLDEGILVANDSGKVPLAKISHQLDLIRDHVKNSRPILMSPVSDIREVSDELGQENSGGQKHIRDTSFPPGSPPPSDELGSLCSIFQFFLEPRKYSKCRISNAGYDNDRNDGLALASPLSRTGTETDAGFGFSGNYPLPVSNEVTPVGHHTGSDSYHSESENREIESDSQRQIHRQSRPELDHRHGGETPASKRYDQLEDIQSHGHQDDENPHHLVPPENPQIFPKSLLDRTTIIVPERPCPRGERRDHKGYCRRIVRVRPSYQYGPPPPPYGPSRPIRYYYSRFVSVPTLQFFIPAVR